MLDPHWIQMGRTPGLKADSTRQDRQPAAGMQGWHDSAATVWYNCNQLVVEGYNQQWGLMGYNHTMMILNQQGDAPSGELS